MPTTMSTAYHCRWEGGRGRGGQVGLQLRGRHRHLGDACKASETFSSRAWGTELAHLPGGLVTVLVIQELGDGGLRGWGGGGARWVGGTARRCERCTVMLPCKPLGNTPRCRTSSPVKSLVITTWLPPSWLAMRA